MLLHEAASDLDLSKVSVAIDRAHGDSLGGRLCVVDVSVAGKDLRLASVYAPVDPGMRKLFFESLTNSKVLTKHTIAQGDWNCVEDVSVDVSYLDGSSPATYPNLQGNALHSLMSSVGLADPLRLFHGDLHKDFTRRGRTVCTRLDRFYAPQYNSLWRWTKVETHPTFWRDHDNPSDHLAVQAEIEWANDRKPTQADRRIDPRIFLLPEVRDTVEEIWKQVYSSFPPSVHGEAKAFVRAKETVAEYLLNRSYELSPAKLEISKMEDTLKLLHLRASTHPTTRLLDIIAKKEREWKEAKAANQGSVWWNYIVSLGEEVSSKVFYRRFRAKLANSDFSSIHVTPDWNEPDKKDPPTADPDLVAAEQAKYYKHLFGSKPSVRPERMLELLKGQRINPSRANRNEEPITEPQVRTAIRKLAKGKAPGPDALPAEFYQQFEGLIIGPLFRTIEEPLTQG